VPEPEGQRELPAREATNTAVRPAGSATPNRERAQAGDVLDEKPLMGREPFRVLKAGEYSGAAALIRQPVHADDHHARHAGRLRGTRPSVRRPARRRRTRPPQAGPAGAYTVTCRPPS